MKFTKKKRQKVKAAVILAVALAATFHGGMLIHKFFFTVEAKPLQCKILRVSGDSNSDMFRDPHDPSALILVSPTQIQCINSEKELKAVMPTNEDPSGPRL
jgi:hypothetical protein